MNFVIMKKKDIKILLVDDEQDILEIVGYNLTQEGYQVVTAGNGKEAITKAKKRTAASNNNRCNDARNGRDGSCGEHKEDPGA